MICESHGLCNVFKNMLISPSRCDLSSFSALCLRWQIAFRGRYYSSLSTCYLSQAPWFVPYKYSCLPPNPLGEAKLGTKPVPLVLLPLFACGVNCHPPRNSLCSVQAFSLKFRQKQYIFFSQ